MSFNKYRLKGAYHYDWYENQEWYKLCVDECVDFCKGSTLDVGCGDGVVANKIAERYKGVAGVDNDPTAIALANERRGKAQFILHDLNVPITNRQWEYMVCLNVIEHLDNPQVIKNLIKKKGPATTIGKGAIIMTLEWQGGAFGEDHKKEYTLPELTDFFKEFKPKPFRIKKYPEWIGVKIKL